MELSNGVNPQLLNEVAGLYSWLDSQIQDYNKLGGLCSACGQCCNFRQFDHLLFVTSPELIYLAAKLDGKLKKMLGNACPWNESGKCTIYTYRFSGCRIFCCKADKDLQVVLSELAVKKLKTICEQFDIPYTYTDLKSTLAKFCG